MKASLDTNVIIHLYKAGMQGVLFDVFDEGVFIYEQIRNIELSNHGQDILEEFDTDVAAGKIKIYTHNELQALAIYTIFDMNFQDNRQCYVSSDLGEVYAISLAQTLGAHSLVTDDIKQGGPYMSLLQFEDVDVMPFTFADVLIIRYLMGIVSAEQTVDDFNVINESSELNWTFQSQIAKFIRRFFKDPYRSEDTIWIQKLQKDYKIIFKEKFNELKDCCDR